MSFMPRAALCSFFAALFGLTAISAHSATTDFDQRLLHYKNNPNDLPAVEVIEFFRNHHIVLVPGYMSDLIPLLNIYKNENIEYFKHTIDALEELDVTTTVHQPSSLSTIAQSGRWLAQSAHKYFVNGGNKPIILIGHSRGGPVAVHALLTQTDLVAQNKVHRAVTVQAPVYGNRAITAKTEALSRLSLLPSGNFGLGSLRPADIARDVGTEVYMSLSASEQKLIDSAVLWFTASKPVKDISDLKPAFREAFYQDGQIVRSDHYVALENQWGEYGQVIDHSEQLNHIETVLPAQQKAGADKTVERALTARAFTFALLESIYINMLSSSEQVQTRSQQIINSIGITERDHPVPAKKYEGPITNCLKLLLAISKI